MSIFTLVMLSMMINRLSTQDYADYGHGLASGSEDVLLEPYDDSFSCEERTYGYYGDVNNNCQVFHICLPITDTDGSRILRYNKYSFVCGNGTVFDQEALVCNYPENALPCEDSNQLYGLVEFGRIEDY